MNKEMKKLRNELRKSKHRIKRLEKSLGENTPTFVGYDSKTGSNQGKSKWWLNQK